MISNITLPIRLLAIIIIAYSPIAISTQPDTETSGELDLILQGFEESNKTTTGKSHVNAQSEIIQPSKQNKQNQTPSWEYHADVSISYANNYAHEAPPIGTTDYRGLSRLKYKYTPEFSWHIGKDWKVLVNASAFYDRSYHINEQNQYSDEYLDLYEKEAEIREAFVQGSIGPDIDIKIGKQIVVWGKSDNIRIVDVLNPLDKREPGMVDIEDIRLPVTITRIDYYTGQWNLSVIAIHEIRFNKIPVFNSDYFPGTQPAPTEIIPSDGNENTEYAVSVNGVFSGWDMSLHWADIFDDQPHITAIAPGQLIQQHSKITLQGLAANFAFGNWLLKSEFAQLSGIEYSNTANQQFIRNDSLVGIEYAGFNDTNISLEVADRAIKNFNPLLKQSPDNLNKHNYQIALRYIEKFLNDRTEFLLLSSVFGKSGEEGGFTRLSIKHDISDGYSATIGLTTYHNGIHPRFQAISNNDRVFFDVKYSF